NVLRNGESSRRKKSPPKSASGIRKAQQQQSRFRSLREEELQGPPSRTRASLKRRLHEPSSTKPQVQKKQDPSRNGDKKHAAPPKENPGTDAHEPNAGRKDIYEIFAEPVDPEEVCGFESSVYLVKSVQWFYRLRKLTGQTYVEDYYEIIEEPMDFGTMRAKLHEGMYTSLEQFEVFLLFNKLIP
ncbi:Bromodomain-containing protein, partial [Cynara cardunculus var. scolymus]